MDENGSGPKHRYWGEALKSDLLSEIHASTAEISDQLKGKVGWGDVAKGIALGVVALGGFAAWMLYESKSSARSEAQTAVIIATEPIRQQVSEAKVEARSAQLQAVEAQKDIRALSKQIATRQTPSRLEREPRVMRAPSEPAAPPDGGP